MKTELSRDEKMRLFAMYYGQRVLKFSKTAPATQLMIPEFMSRITDECVLVLRPLSDMTEDELQECGNMIYDFSNDPELNNFKWKDFEIGLAPEQFVYLLSKGFDLFGLIPSGLAIDNTKNKGV